MQLILYRLGKALKFFIKIIFLLIGAGSAEHHFIHHLLISAKVRCPYRQRTSFLQFLSYQHLSNIKLLF